MKWPVGTKLTMSFNGADLTGTVVTTIDYWRCILWSDDVKSWISVKTLTKRAEEVT